MSRFDIKPRLKHISGRVGGLVRGLATPLQAAHLSPLAGIILALLGAAALGAALLAAYALLGPAGLDDGAAAPDWTPPTLAVVDLDPPQPPSADVETLSRPIFSKSRRPSGKPAKAPAADGGRMTPSPAGLSVAAVVRNRKESRAFVVSVDTPEGAWRKIGDTVDAWTISRIERAEVTLENGGEKTTLKLYPDPDPNAQAAPSTDAPPQMPQPPTPQPPD